MKWIEILRNKNYALLQSESNTQYCVASDYDPTEREDNQWSHGTYFTYQNDTQKANSLANALELFRYRTEDNYIPRYRLEELATLFKDGLLEDDRGSAIEYFNEICEMEDYEKDFFEIKTEED